MNRFAGPLRIELTAHAADYVVLAGLSGLSLLACFGADPKLATVTFPPLVAVLAYCWTRLCEPRWRALRFADEPGWQALSADGGWDSVAVKSNFRCAAVVLVTIRRRYWRQPQALWRHHQPDEFRRMLARIDEGRDA